jgi:hypothetical protein
VHAINKFRHYIIGYEIFIHTNHSSIIYIMNKPTTNGRITRWILLLQEFNITILDRPVRENLVVDFISSIHNEGEIVLVNDGFSNENLFSIYINTPWFTYITNYFSTGKLPQQLHQRRRRGLLDLVPHIHGLAENAFCTGPNLIM